MAMDISFDADDIVKVIGIVVVIVSISKFLVEFGTAAFT